MDDIFEHKKAIINNIAKSFGVEDVFEKARSGVYSDNAENRRLNRVGQRYGSTKKNEQTNIEGKNKNIDDYAKKTSTENLEKVVNNKNAPDDLKDAAKRELANRSSDDSYDKNKEEFYNEVDNLKQKISKIIKRSGLDKDYPGNFSDNYMNTMLKSYYNGDLKKIRDNVEKSIKNLKDDRKYYQDTTWHDNKIKSNEENLKGYDEIINLFENSEIINNNKPTVKKTIKQEQKSVETLDEHIENITDDFVNMFSLWDKNFRDRDYVDENGKEWEDVQRDYYKNVDEGKETVNKIKAAVKKFGRREVFARLSGISKKNHYWSNKELKILMSYV